MRNLKKALSLALALVMLLGMMMVGAGAAEINDIDSVDANNQEAVKVMSAIDIIKGDENGNFNPDGTLRRAEAAVIISKVLLTPAVVEKLSGTQSSFTDVADYEDGWAVPYVEACALPGIIAGNGDGTFDPAGNVTGLQFAKMLLVTLGFDPDTYNGKANWEMLVRQDAIKAGLDTNSVAITGNDLSRADAAQMAFNALLYSPTGNVWKVGNLEFDNMKDAALYAAVKGGGAEPVKAPAKDSLAVTRFGLDEGTGKDAYGREVKTWNVEGVKDPIYTATESIDKPVKTYTAASNTVEKDLEGYAYDGAKKITVNGADAKAISLNNIKEQIGNGNIVEVYADSDKKVNQVVVIAPAIVTVNKIDDKTGAITLSNGKKIDEKSDFAGLIGQVEKGDKLVCVSNSKALLSVKPAEIITGTMTALSDKRVATIDGQNVSGVKGYTVPDLVGKDVTAVMINGYASSVEETGEAVSDTEAGDGYIWVTNIWVEGNSKYDNTKTAYVMGVLANGEVATLKLGNPTSAGSVGADWNNLPESFGISAATNTASNGAALTIDPATTPAMTSTATAGKLVEGLYYYYTGKGTNAGKVLLCAPKTADVTDVASEGNTAGVSTTQAKIGDASSPYISSSVAIVWVSGEGDTLNASVTGREAIAKNKAYTYITDKDNRVAVIFVGADAVVSEDTIFVVTSDNKVAYTDKDGKTQSGYVVKCYERGATEAEDIIAAAKPETGFYTAVANGEGYVLTSVAGSTSAKTSELAAGMYNGFLTIGATLVNVKDADIIDLRGGNDPIVNVSDLEATVNTNGLNVYVSLIIKTGDIAEAVYIMKTQETSKAVTVTEETVAGTTGGNGKAVKTEESGSFQLPTGTAVSTDNKIVIVLPNGGKSNAISDWGDPAKTRGFVCSFDAGSHDGHAIKLSIKKGTETVYTEEKTVAANSQGYFFYDDHATDPGVYTWTITCGKAAVGPDSAGGATASPAVNCGTLASGQFEVLGP